MNLYAMNRDFKNKGSNPPKWNKLFCCPHTPPSKGGKLTVFWSSKAGNKPDNPYKGSGAKEDGTKNIQSRKE